MNTRTGQFPIGFRLGWTPWYKDFSAVAKWAKEKGFSAIDVNVVTPEVIQTLKQNNLQLGSVDFHDFSKLCTKDDGLRKELLAKNLEYIPKAAALGAKNFFTIVAGEPTEPRIENYKRAVEVFGALSEAVHKVGGKIIIEGYPGGAPNYAVLCCTPESIRMILKDCGPGMGLNYDPSHLIRLGVDPIRFLNEFLPHIHHVHGKDTELFPEAAYEYGIYQGALSAKEIPFGQHVWRYTIPGHGQMRWTEAFKILSKNGYKGIVSVELEDADFNGSEEGEKRGLETSLSYLSGV